MNVRDRAEPTTLWPAVRAALTETRLASARALRREGLSLGRYFALHWIAASDGRRLSAFAQEFGISRPAATSIVAALESHGWVRRDRALNDRRGVTVRATPRAAVLMRRMERRLERTVSRSAEALPPGDRAAAIDALRRISEALRIEREAEASHPRDGHR